ncbi:MAG: hypothetical protein EOM54_13895 [Clostridia bacterium]|nr:hypothetical protein [Clostridia bacterium]
MKPRVYILLFVFLLSLSLAACSTDKTDSSTSGSGGSGSSQITDTSTSGSAGSASSPEDENSPPMDTYKAVLQNEIGFSSVVDNREFLLNDFLKRNSEYEGTYKVTQFTVLDMDGDKTPEVVLELSLNDNPEQYEILHYSSGTVYGYNFVYRGFEMLKNDGTFMYANSASDVGVVKILSFRSDSVETETLGYAQTDYSGGNPEISYSINKAAAEQEAFDAFLDQQNEKKDAPWYAYSPENIEAKVCMHWNTGLLPEDADNLKSYYGEWVVQKVLAYGIGTYSKDDAEKLIGKRLNFSADEAGIFTDQPSDTATVINTPEYREKTQSSSDFLAEYKMNFDTLGISADSVTEVQVTGPDEVGSVFLMKDGSTMILIAGGTYFELVK